MKPYVMNAIIETNEIIDRLEKDWNNKKSLLIKKFNLILKNLIFKKRNFLFFKK